MELFIVYSLKALLSNSLGKPEGNLCATHRADRYSKKQAPSYEDRDSELSKNPNVLELLQNEVLIA
ncbi:MAG TPA: hypothetical protein VIE89_34110, partial [Candidatus Binatia bacterium]